jgi:predicted acetyltransferase
VGYRVKQEWTNAVPQHTVMLMGSQFVALDRVARAALWRYCLNLDLTQTVRAVGFPVDEPLRWMLADSRRLRVTSLRDDLWVRLLDIPAALSARRYLASGRVVFAVADAFLPENVGCYELVGGSEGAECRRTTGEADLALDVADLGAAYLGGVRFSTLAQAGRVEERTSGALARADTLFASDPAPYCATPF